MIASGGLAFIVNGAVSGGVAGIVTNNSYNNRLFPTLLSASSSNGTAISLSYTYFANGNVNVETNGRDNGRSVTFTYDALGDRVEMTNSSGTLYLGYDAGGNFIKVSGPTSYDIVRWGGWMFTVYFSWGTTFNHVNNLSSTMMYTNQAGTPIEDMMFYPWGQVWESWGTGGYNYAGIPYRDLTTTTDLSASRVHSPGLSRWLSPDPMGGNITNPQSLNRYAYVMNNPTTFTDPSGLCSAADPNCHQPCQIGSCREPGVYPPMAVAPGVFAPGEDAFDLANEGYIATGPVGYCPPEFISCTGFVGGDVGFDGAGFGYAYSFGGVTGGEDGEPFEVGGLDVADESSFFNGGTTGQSPPQMSPCTLETPSGAYTVGPNAVALFQASMANALTSAFSVLNRQGIVPMITSGFRTAAVQAAQQGSPYGAAQVSWHQVGMAVDLNSMVTNFQAIVTAMTGSGLTCGGTFSHPDPVHFQSAAKGTIPSWAQVAACSGVQP